MAAILRLSLLLALGLGACAEPASNAQPEPQPTPEAAAPSPDPTPAPKPEPEETQVIPAAFRGVWAATTEDCVRPAETRLQIAADQLTFYESSGPVESVEAISPAEIHIVVSLTGEGASSQRSFRYRLVEDGSALFDVRNGLQRIRCG
jgi:hypothetical protein